METWENVVDCEHESTFSDCAYHLHVCISWPLCFAYVNNSWIIPYKKCFVKTWTNWLMHLGNTTSNMYFCILFYIVIFVSCFMILVMSFASRLNILTRGWRMLTKEEDWLKDLDDDKDIEENTWRYWRQYILCLKILIVIDLTFSS